MIKPMKKHKNNKKLNIKPVLQKHVSGSQFRGEVLKNILRRFRLYTNTPHTLKVSASYWETDFLAPCALKLHGQMYTVLWIRIYPSEIRFTNAKTKTKSFYNLRADSFDFTSLSLSLPCLFHFSLYISLPL